MRRDGHTARFYPKGRHKGREEAGTYVGFKEGMESYAGGWNSEAGGKAKGQKKEEHETEDSKDHGT